MIDTGKATLYLVPVKPNGWTSLYKVTNWPNTLSFIVQSYTVGNHNIAGKRYDVHFPGPDGYRWHGVSYDDNTQVCHCKRTKTKLERA